METTPVLRRLGLPLVIAVFALIGIATPALATPTTSPYNGWDMAATVTPPGVTSITIDTATTTSLLVWNFSNSYTPPGNLWVINSCNGTVVGSPGFRGTTADSAGASQSGLSTLCSSGAVAQTQRYIYAGACCSATVAQVRTGTLILDVSARFGALLPPPPVDAVVCDGGKLSEVQASLVNGKDLASWRWTGDPTTAMAVQWLDASGNVITTKLKATPYGPWTVDGDPNYFTNHANKLPTSTDAIPSTAVTVRVGPWTGSSLSCAASGTVITTGVIDVGPVVGGSGTPAEGDGEAENGCGFSVNPVKWMKCLFLPADGALEGWSDHTDNITSRPPISLVSGTFGYMDGYLSALRCSGGSFTGLIGTYQATGGACGSGSTLNPTVFSYGGVDSDPLAAAGDRMDSAGGHLAYNLMVTALWGFFFFAVWNLVMGALGDKTTTMGGGGEL